MLVLEFKAWFEGFTEGMDEAPTEKQWKRIKARVKEIDGAAITYPVYVDRWRPYWSYLGYSTGGIGLGSQTLGQATSASNTLSLNAGEGWNSAQAMYSAGLAERAELNS